MKKFIFALTAVSIIATASAQTKREAKFSVSQTENLSSLPAKANSSNFNKSDVSSWYSYGSWLNSPNVPYSAGLKGYVDFLYHDSVAKSVMIFSTGEQTVYGFGKISIASIMDPKDDIMDLTDDATNKLYRSVGYMLDSVNFVYRYIRNVDSLSDGLGGKLPVVDTLFVSYFKGANIAKRSLIFTGPPKDTMNYAELDWQGGSVRLPKTYYKMDTILLSKLDTTTVFNSNGGFENSWTGRQKTLKAPAGMTVAANQTNDLTGFAISFKSGVKTVVGTDTAIMIYQKDPSTLAPGTRRTNYFGYSMLSNEGGIKWENPTYYNTSLFVESNSAYTPWVLNANVQFNGFFPGYLYTKELFFNSDFFLNTTTGNVGINDIKNNEFAMTSVYPNPARATEKPVIGFALAKASNVSVNILNIVGQEVKTGFNKHLESGSHAEFIDISGLKAGVYFVNMTVNGNSISKKISIVE